MFHGFNIFINSIIDSGVIVRIYKIESVSKMVSETEDFVISIDGHASHMNNLELIMACQSSGKYIRIAVLPAGQTPKLQPLDRSVFGPLKKGGKIT